MNHGGKVIVTDRTTLQIDRKRRIKKKIPHAELGNVRVLEHHRFMIVLLESVTALRDFMPSDGAGRWPHEIHAYVETPGIAQDLRREIEARR